MASKHNKKKQQTTDIQDKHPNKKRKLQEEDIQESEEEADEVNDFVKSLGDGDEAGGEEEEDEEVDEFSATSIVCVMIFGWFLTPLKFDEHDPTSQSWDFSDTLAEINEDNASLVSTFFALPILSFICVES